jgi:hypothetical protein
MDFKFSFRQIIAHILPGAVLSLGLALLFPKAIFFLNHGQAVIIFLFIIVATFLGMTIDALRHLFIDVFIKEKDDNYFIQAKDELVIYDLLVNEELNYYYEGWSNLAISLIPIFFIYNFLFGQWFSLCSIILVIVFGVLLAEGIITYHYYCIENEKVLRNFNHPIVKP